MGDRDNERGWRLSDVRRRGKARHIRAVDSISPTVVVVDIESPREGTGERRKRMATVATTLGDSSQKTSSSPAFGIAKAITEALDPNNAPRPVKSFATMTEAEREEMRRLYNKGK